MPQKQTAVIKAPGNEDFYLTNIFCFTSTICTVLRGTDLQQWQQKNEILIFHHVSKC
jgi:hypothetical protein